MRQDFESLGDTLKGIERNNQQHLSDMFPVYARLDGKKFSKFTRGMDKPFDDAFNQMMTELCHVLVEETNAKLVYHQSDEISLYWDTTNDMMYGGRKDKMVGELCGLAASKFMQLTQECFPDKVERFPRFDCRIFNVDQSTAVDFFMWRQMDCIKNSVSQLASAYFSHKKLLHVTTNMRKQMLNDINKPWEELNPMYKYGTFLRKEQELQDIDKTHIDPIYHHNVPDKALRNVIKRRIYSPIQQFDDKLELLDIEQCRKYEL